MGYNHMLSYLAFYVDPGDYAQVLVTGRQALYRPSHTPAQCCGAFVWSEVSLAAHLLRELRMPEPVCHSWEGAVGFAGCSLALFLVDNHTTVISCFCSSVFPTLTLIP